MRSTHGARRYGYPSAMSRSSTRITSPHTLTDSPCACAGEATAGKTQTCLQLLLSVQWPKSHGGLEGSAL